MKVELAILKHKQFAYKYCQDSLEFLFYPRIRFSSVKYKPITVIDNFSSPLTAVNWVIF